MLNVLDSHLIDQRDDVDEVFQSLNTKVLTMGFTDDLLYPDRVRAVGERFKYHRHFLFQTMQAMMVLLNFNDWAPNLYHFLKFRNSNENNR